MRGWGGGGGRGQRISNGGANATLPKNTALAHSIDTIPYSINADIDTIPYSINADIHVHC